MNSDGSRAEAPPTVWVLLFECLQMYDLAGHGENADARRPRPTLLAQLTSSCQRALHVPVLTAFGAAAQRCYSKVPTSAL